MFFHIPWFCRVVFSLIPSTVLGWFFMVSSWFEKATSSKSTPTSVQEAFLLQGHQRQAHQHQWRIVSAQKNDFCF